jgi:Tol biopolymer transport system component
LYSTRDARMPAMTPDGRYVAYVTGSSMHFDVMVRDRQTGVLEVITVPFDGSYKLGGSTQPSISADGRFVAFASSLQNLVPGDVWDTWDIFVRDRATGTTSRQNPGLGGAAANGFSCCTSISADGRYLAFRSDASNLVPDDAAGTCDYFVRDQVARTTERVITTSFGAQTNACGTYYPSLSADGRFVSFSSDASNLVDNDFNASRDVFIHEVGGPSIGTTSFTINPIALFSVTRRC